MNDASLISKVTNTDQFRNKKHNESTAIQKQTCDNLYNLNNFNFNNPQSNKSNTYESTLANSHLCETLVLLYYNGLSQRVVS